MDLVEFSKVGLQHQIWYCQISIGNCEFHIFYQLLITDFLIEIRYFLIKYKVNESEVRKFKI